MGGARATEGGTRARTRAATRPMGEEQEGRAAAGQRQSGWRAAEPRVAGSGRQAAHLQPVGDTRGRLPVQPPAPRQRHDGHGGQTSPPPSRHRAPTEGSRERRASAIDGRAGSGDRFVYLSYSRPNLTPNRRSSGSAGDHLVFSLSVCAPITLTHLVGATIDTPRRIHHEEPDAFARGIPDNTWRRARLNNTS